MKNLKLFDDIDKLSKNHVISLNSKLYVYTLGKQSRKNQLVKNSQITDEREDTYS
jgi:hypothetical protein